MMFRNNHLSPTSKVINEDITLFLVLKKHFGSHFNKTSTERRPLYLFLKDISSCEM